MPLNKPKILEIDIETSPHTAYVWGLFKENVPIQRLIETGRVMCFAAKWLGNKEIHFHSEWNDGHENMINRAHELMSEADGIVHYNGNKFDIPTLNKEFVYYKIPPAAPVKHIDLYKVVRSSFRFPSNKLDYVSQQLGLGKKASHEGFELWVKCMNGEEVAQRKMERYNIQDVRLLESLYKRLLPWIQNHPNYALFNPDIKRPVCPNCGSTHQQSRGYYDTKTMRYQRFQCQKCGTWTRERVNSNTPEQKANTRVSVK